MARMRSLMSGQQPSGEDGGGEGLLKQVPTGGMPQAAEQESGGFQLPDMGELGGEPDVHRKVPTPIDPQAAKSGETGRDRGMMGGMGANASPRRPSSPTPMAGSISMAPMPFKPLGDIGGQGMGMGSLFGGAGGLKGGGLGVPLDPTSNQASGSIEDLLQMLLGKKGL